MSHQLLIKCFCNIYYFIIQGAVQTQNQVVIQDRQLLLNKFHHQSQEVDPEKTLNLLNHRLLRFLTVMQVMLLQENKHVLPVQEEASIL